MALSGLDDGAVVTAMRRVREEGGAWLLLSYATRDSVMLDAAGEDGLEGIRRRLNLRPEESPLFGYINYLQRRTVIKYEPKISRSMQARLTVHVQAFTEHLGEGVDGVVTIKSISGLTESALSNANDALPDTASAASSPISAFAPESGDSNRGVESPKRLRSIDSITTDSQAMSSVILGISDLHSSDSRRKASVSTDRSVLSKGVEVVRPMTSPVSPTNGSFLDLDQPLPTSYKKSMDTVSHGEYDQLSTRPRTSMQSTRTMGSTNYTGYTTFSGKPKLHARPSLLERQRPHTSASVPRRLEHRPVSTLPPGVSIKRKAVARPPPMPSPEEMSRQITSKSLPTLPLDVGTPTLDRSIQPLSPPRLPHVADQVQRTGAGKSTPDKDRLMRALAIRRANMAVAQAKSEELHSGKAAPGDAKHREMTHLDSASPANIDPVSTVDPKVSLDNPVPGPSEEQEAVNQPTVQPCIDTESSQETSGSVASGVVAVIGHTRVVDPPPLIAVYPNSGSETENSQLSAITPNPAGSTHDQLSVLNNDVPTDLQGVATATTFASSVPLQAASMKDNSAPNSDSPQKQRNENLEDASAGEPSNITREDPGADAASSESTTVTQSHSSQGQSDTALEFEDREGFIPGHHKNASSSTSINLVQHYPEQQKPQPNDVGSGVQSPSRLHVVETEKMPALDSTSCQDSGMRLNESDGVDPGSATARDDPEVISTPDETPDDSATEAGSEPADAQLDKSEALLDVDDRSASDASERSTLSDSDALLESLQTAKIENATPVVVTPIGSSFPQLHRPRTPSGGRMLEAKGFQGEEGGSPRSVTDELSRSRTQEGIIGVAGPASPNGATKGYGELSGLKTKTVNVSRGISQRIKALEMISSRNASPQAMPRPPTSNGVISPTHSMTNAGQASVKKRSTSIKKPVKEAGSSASSKVASPTPSKPSPFAELARLSKLKVHGLNKSETSRSKGEKATPVSATESATAETTRPVNNKSRISVSVIARIIRSPVGAKGDRNLPAADRSPLQLHQSPITIEHQTSSGEHVSPTIHSSTSDALASVFGSAGQRRRTSVSSRRSSVSRTRARSPVRTSMSSSNVALFDEQDETSSERRKKDSRRSRIMKRMSSLSSNSRKSQPSKRGSARSPPVAEEDIEEDPDAMSKIPEHSISLPNPSFLDEQRRVLLDQEVNVQLPDSLLWRRRALRLDSTGSLTLSQVTHNSRPSTAGGVAGQTRHYHLGEFRAIGIPDEDMEDLPNSIQLECQDGGLLQLACGYKNERDSLLRILKDVSYGRA